MNIGEFIRTANYPDGSVIYIIRDETEVLYVGKSFGIHGRILDHFGYSNRWSSGWFSETARELMPASLDWTIEFIQFPDDHPYPDVWADYRESELINQLQPKHNIQCNPRYRSTYK